MINNDDIIKSQPFRSAKKLKKEILKSNPQTSKGEIKILINKRVHDKRPKQNAYMYRIFSHTPNTYQHDLLEQPNDSDPKYFHIFINVNTRFAQAIPLANKSSQAIHQSLSTFINNYHPSRLISDSEPSFTSAENLKLLKDNNVKQLIVQDLQHNHSSLGVIDRFIKTLRDMNIPRPKSKRESTDQKYKSFTITKMQKLIDTYNNSYHSTIKMEPIQMQNDPELEKDYIIKMSKRRNKQNSLPDFELPLHSFVRYILPRPDAKNNKKRFTTSFEAYKIDSRDGNLYNIMAQDGTTIMMPRFKLVPTTLTENMKWAQTIPDKWNGTIEKIISYNPRTNKYKVLFTVPNQDPYQDEIPAVNLRGKYPHLMSEIESKFHKA